MDKLFLKALSFAAEKHSKQRRKDVDASPYINHPIALANILLNEGDVSDINVLCAAILHDTIEDTETTAEELQQLFGDKITSIVLEVTDDKSIKVKKKRKDLQIARAPNISYEAKLVKLADKISNLRDIKFNPPVKWSEKTKLEYFEWAKKVIDGVRGTNQKLEDIFDALQLTYNHNNYD